ncbi:MAG: membrane dipeptidase [Gammaproteobacteria bacterium]|nr:membrane dipeptidase [Gammaproteobacteria bacterium]
MTLSARPARYLVFLAAVALGGCTTAPPDANLQERARMLAQRLLIVDSHIDVPYRLQETPADVSRATADGDFDYPRAREGGLNVPFMSVYIPAEREADGTATALANELIDGVAAIAAASPEKFALAPGTADVKNQFADGIMSLALGMENGAPIAGDLDNLAHFYTRGIRYITLTHSKSNHICDSSYDEERPWGGLSPFGKTLIPAMNRTGVMIDVSHISDKAFFDVIQITHTPVIASHSSARHFTPGFERNMSDEMIRALAANGGVIMINFGSTFVHQPSRDNYDTMKAARDAWLEAKGLVDDKKARDEFTARYRQTTPFLFADIRHVLDHIDHVARLVGVDYVGLGSDFDGVGDSLPTGIKDVSMYPNLIAGMLQRGYTETEVEKVLGGNLMRVWQQVEDYARTH